MIAADIKVLDHADIEGRTALMWAAGKGANDVIIALLQLRSHGHEGGTYDRNFILSMELRLYELINIG